MKCFNILVCCLGCLLVKEILCDTPCPDGWVPFQGACFLFGTDQRLRYNEAQHFCTQHGGNLARVRDQHDSNFLHHWLTHLKPYPWWIGLNDQEIENEYKWIDTHTAPEYTNWLPGRPSSTNVTYNQDCITVQPNAFQWMDTDCVAPFQPICQIIVSNGVSAVG
ncbi:C-type lectin (CTL) or carbohydrate-recognition domain (CRD) [Mactra antiquata]